MDVASLKEYIYNEDFVETVLENLDCHHIKRHSNEYITCGNPDGDNASAIVVYLTENLNTIDYTRCLSKTKKSTDLIDLVMFLKDITFPQAMKYLCETLGLDYYYEEEVPESLQILSMLQKMNHGVEIEQECQLKPISEKILSYYLPYGNKMWEDSNVSLSTQRFFELSFDLYTNSVAIPIRDELGNLIAVKGRRLEYDPNIGGNKYFFIEPGAKSQVLYGLYQNSKSIQNQGIVYVGESERFVHQLYELGYYGVSTGGSKISKRQIEMLTRLGVQIVFCYDEDQTEDDMRHIADMFMDGINIYAMLDRDKLLNSKESPSDHPDIWYKMVQNNIYKIK